MAKLAELIRQIVAPMFKDIHTRAKIVSVDVNDFTCEVETLNGKSQRFDVKLRAIADGEDTGFILIPKVDSIVLIGLIDNDLSDPFISKYSEIDGVLLVQKNLSKLEVKDDGKVIWKAIEIFFDGATNGLIKIPSIVSKLNEHENKINALLAAHNAHQHPETGVTTGLPTITVSGTLPLTTQSDLRHNKIEF